MSPNQKTTFSQRVSGWKGIFDSIIFNLWELLGEKNRTLRFQLHFKSKNFETFFGIKLCWGQDTKDSYLARDLCFLPTHLPVMPVMEINLKEMEPRPLKGIRERHAGNYLLVNGCTEKNQHLRFVSGFLRVKPVNRNCIMFNGKRGYWKICDIWKTNWIISETLSICVYVLWVSIIYIYMTTLLYSFIFTIRSIKYN